MNELKMIFRYYNTNPLKKETGDCVVRALAFFLGVTWRKAFLNIIAWCADQGLVSFNYRRTYTMYLKEIGYRRNRVPRKGMTVGEFRDGIAEKGRTYIISIPHHLTVIQDGVLYDTWDCSEKIMDGYWVR